MDFFIHLIIIISIFAILALSLNLLVGFTGLLSLASSAFMGIGAYAVAIMTTTYGINFFIALMLAIIISGFAALLVDLVLSRFSGDYFSIGSLGIAIIASGLFVNWQSITNGPVGISGIPRPSISGFEFTENWQIMLMALFLLAIVYILCMWITSSSFGRVLRAIREDEKAVEIFGYKTREYKLIIFIISGMLAAISGGIFAAYFSYISPVSFTVSDSIVILTMIILGGLSSNLGAVVGAMCLVLLPELLRFVGLPSNIAADTKQIIYGMALILVVIYRPQGLLGKYRI